MDAITLVFESDESGGFSAYVAEVPGVNSQGDSLDEARKMVLEALLELSEYRREKARMRFGATCEEVHVARNQSVQGT